MCLFELWFSLCIYPVVGLLDHMVALFLVFYGIYSSAVFMESTESAVLYSDCINLHSHQ